VSPKELLMATRIPTNQIQNLQQVEAVVAGPEGANRLFTVTGLFSTGFGAYSRGSELEPRTETFTVLIGPALTRQQFFRAISIASLVNTTLQVAQVGSTFSWAITDVDADWDDESGQVELRVGVSAVASGANNGVTIGAIAFQVTILAAVAA